MIFRKLRNEEIKSLGTDELIARLFLFRWLNIPVVGSYRNANVKKGK